jgi:hypothetical protein
VKFEGGERGRKGGKRLLIHFYSFIFKGYKITKQSWCKFLKIKFITCNSKMKAVLNDDTMHSKLFCLNVPQWGTHLNSHQALLNRCSSLKYTVINRDWAKYKEMYFI